MARGRFWWFGGNSFYATTSLTGFSFINEAKNKAEKCLWYLLLMFFMGVTLYNVVKLTNLYLSKPTATSARVATDIEDLTLPNFTISLTTSIDIFANGVPLLVPPYLSDVLCVNGIPLAIRHRFRYEEDSVLTGEYLGTPDAFWKMLKQFRNPAKQARFSDINNSLRNKSNHIRDVFAEHRESTIFTGDYMQTSVNKLRATLESLGPDADYANIFTALLLLKNQTGINDKISSILKGNKMNMKNLLYATQRVVLNEFVLLESENSNDVKLTLRDWRLDSNKRKQTFTFHIEPQDGINQVSLKIYLLKLVRYLMSMDALIEHAKVLRYACKNNIDLFLGGTHVPMQLEFFEACMYEYYHSCLSLHKNPDYFRVKCNRRYIKLADFFDFVLELGNSYSLIYFTNDAMDTILREIELNSIMETINHYEDTTFVNIDLFGKKLQLLPFHNNEVKIYTTGRFISQTLSCKNGTELDCIDKCIGQIHEQECDCYPWMLEYLYKDTGRAMCSGPCSLASNSSELCKQNCNQKHNCDSTVTRTQTSQVKINHLKWRDNYDEFDDGRLIMWRETALQDHLPISHLHIYLPSNSHYPVYIETYMMNDRNFISQLSGILEFWLGINVTGLVHLIIYLFRQIYRFFDPYSKTRRAWRHIFGRSSSASGNTSRNLLKMRKTNDMIIREINQLLKTHKRGMDEQNATNESGDDKRKTRKFLWLFKNNFFKETPLTGFSYIDSSKSKIEAIVWYIMLAIFLYLTTQSIWDTYEDFRQKPTTTTLQVDLSYQDMENITLKINVSWFEFQGNLPFIYRQGSLDFTTYLEAKNLICEQASEKIQDSKIDDLIGDITCSLARYYYTDSLQFESVSFLKLCKFKAPYFLKETAEVQVNHEWNTEIIKQTKQQLQEAWAKHRAWLLKDTGNSTGKIHPLAPRETAQHLYNIMENMKDDTAKEGQIAVIPLLMLLDLIDTDDTASIYATFEKYGIAKLFDRLDEDDRKYYLERKGFKKTHWAEYLKDNRYRGLGLGSITKFAYSIISQLLPLQTEDPRIQVVLQQARVMDKKQVELSYQIVPKDENVQKIRLHLHSFEMMRYLLLMQSMVEHISLLKMTEAQGFCNNSCLKELYCSKQGLWYVEFGDAELIFETPGSNVAEYINLNQRDISGDTQIYDYENIEVEYQQSIYAIYKRSLSAVLNHYKDTTSIELSTASGSTFYESFKHHQVTYLPTSTFLSEKEDCYTGTINHCTIQCELECHLKHCGCHPWYLHYLEPNRKICSKSCSAAKPEQENCTQNCPAPCSIPLHREQHFSAPIKHIEWEVDREFGFEKLLIDPSLPLATFEIGLQKLQHPKMTETYTMSRSTLISRIGGLMELWLGFNIVAAIHLIIYIIKQCIHVTRKDSKNRKFIKFIFGGKNAVQEEEEEEETEQDATGDDIDMIMIKHKEIVMKWRNSEQRLGSSKGKQKGEK